jgi:universal stress protein A
MMKRRYTRILAVIDLGKRGEEVACRALEVARTYNAKLGVAHVLDYGAGFEDDHVPFLTPQQTEEKLTAVTRERLISVLERIGARDAEMHVTAGHSTRALARLVSEWGADLVVVGSHARHALDRSRPFAETHNPLTYDVLAVQTEEESALRRLLHSLLSPVLAWG